MRVKKLYGNTRRNRLPNEDEEEEEEEEEEETADVGVSSSSSSDNNNNNNNNTTNRLLAAVTTCPSSHSSSANPINTFSDPLKENFASPISFAYPIYPFPPSLENSPQDPASAVFELMTTSSLSQYRAPANGASNGSVNGQPSLHHTLRANGLAAASLAMPSPLHALTMTSMPSLMMNNVNVNANTNVAATKSSASSSSPAKWQQLIAPQLRDRMRLEIVTLLKTLKPNAPEAILSRLPALASTLEELMLRNAPSESDYGDLSTLPQRVGRVYQLKTQQHIHRQAQSLTVSSPSSASLAASSPLGRAASQIHHDQALFVYHQLQKWRQEIVDSVQQVPWEIASNSVLSRVAFALPKDNQELINCGIVAPIVERFGRGLLARLQSSVALFQQKQASGVNPGSGADADAGANTGSRKKAGARTPPPAPSSASGMPPSGRNALKKRRITNANCTGGANNLHLLSAGSSVMEAATTASSESVLANSNSTSSPGSDDHETSLSSTSSSSLPTLFAASALKTRLTPQLLATSTNAPRLLPSMLPASPSGSAPPGPGGSGGGAGAGALDSSCSTGAKTIDWYEKELQQLRWLYDQSQETNRRLEAEIDQLRQQLSR